MPLYAVAAVTTVTTTASAIGQVLAGASDAPRLMQALVQLATATVARIGLGRPATGGTASTSVTVTPLNPSDPAGRSTLATAWSVAPTTPTAWLRLTHLSANIGTFQWLTFPSGLAIPASGSLVFWSLSVVPLVEISVLVDE